MQKRTPSIGRILRSLLSPSLNTPLRIHVAYTYASACVVYDGSLYAWNSWCNLQNIVRLFIVDGV